MAELENAPLSMIQVLLSSAILGSYETCVRKGFLGTHRAGRQPLDAPLPEPLEWVTSHQQAFVPPRLLLTQGRLVPPCEHILTSTSLPQLLTRLSLLLFFSRCSAQNNQVSLYKL